MAAQGLVDLVVTIGHRREVSRWPCITPPLAAPGTPGCSDRQPNLIGG